MKIMSAEAELESSFVSDLQLHHLAFEYFIVWNYTVPFCKQDAIVRPIFLLQVGHVFQGERI